MLLQLLPDPNGQILRRTHFTLKKINFDIQIPVIQFLDDMILNDTAQFFYIEQKSRIRVRVTFYRHIQLVIMPMPILIGAFAEYGLILILTPAWIIEFVRCVKMLQARQIHHNAINKNFRKGNT
jgi:hypothetical protein